MNKKLVSVIIPVFNGEQYIGRCLRSILHQSLDQDKYEIIIVNDGSIDKTHYALELFEGGIIKVINNSKNFGLPYSLNTGIHEAKGKYIIRVDADDYVNEHYLLFLSSYLEMNENHDAVACDYLLVDAFENVISKQNFLESPIGCGIMFKKEQLLDVGVYDSNMKIHEDKDLLTRFLKKYSVNRLEIPLYRYRKHENNMTNNEELVKIFFNKLNKKYIK